MIAHSLEWIWSFCEINPSPENQASPENLQSSWRMLELDGGNYTLYQKYVWLEYNETDFSNGAGKFNPKSIPD